MPGTRIVRAALHEHLRTTSHITPRLVKKAINKAEKRLGKGGILGIINFNPSDTQGDPRYHLFAEYAKPFDAQSFERGLYLPNQDLLIFKGQEVPTKEGYHILLLGMPTNESIPNNTSLENVLRTTRELGAIKIADHPFHHHGIGPELERNPELLEEFDGIETENGI